MAEVNELNEVDVKKSNKKRWTITIIAGVLVLGMIIYGTIDTRRRERELQAQIEEEERLAAEAEIQRQQQSNTSDSLIMRNQESYTARYGVAPDNYIWDMDGTLLSLGDKKMTSEEVVYAYFNGLSALDFSTVQKFSRGSSVANRYTGYFNKQFASQMSYSDSFYRNMYKECLLSIQVKGVLNTSIFAENKQVFTVEVSMLDLTQKDFWLSDKNTIYSNLYLYNSTENDSIKGDIFLYDYILDYYKGTPQRRDVTFDITVEKYPDLDTGWLVSIDNDVDTACRYANGNLVLTYIKNQYQYENRDYFETHSMFEDGKDTDEVISQKLEESSDFSSKDISSNDSSQKVESKDTSSIVEVESKEEE